MSERLDHRTSPLNRRRRAIPPDPEAVAAAYGSEPNKAAGSQLHRFAIAAAILGVLTSVAIPGAKESPQPEPQQREAKFDPLKLQSRQLVEVDLALEQYREGARASFVVVPVFQIRGDRDNAVVLAETTLRHYLDRVRQTFIEWATTKSRSELMNANGELERLALSLQGEVFPNDEGKLVGLEIRSLEFY
ncbi:MAG: hypothetical protein AAF196_02665 [Planctomycetota bacterium]